MVVPLLRKNGSPGEDFDGDAFLVDRVRANTLQEVRERAEEPIITLQEVTSRMEELEKDEESKALSDAARLEEAKAAGVEEEWVVRWELWSGEKQGRKLREELKRAKEAASRLCPGGKCFKDEDIPFLELKEVRAYYSREKGNVERFKNEEPGDRFYETTELEIQ